MYVNKKRNIKLRRISSRNYGSCKVSKKYLIKFSNKKEKQANITLIGESYKIIVKLNLNINQSQAHYYLI